MDNTHGYPVYIDALIIINNYNYIYLTTYLNVLTSGANAEKYFTDDFQTNIIFYRYKLNSIVYYVFFLIIQIIKYFIRVVERAESLILSCIRHCFTLNLR